MNKEIFKAYDIRGIFNKFKLLDDVDLIGYGLSKILKNIIKTIFPLVMMKKLVQKYTLNFQNPSLKTELVLLINMVTTPLAYFSGIKYSNGNAVMITGSHNPQNIMALRSW